MKHRIFAAVRGQLAGVGMTLALAAAVLVPSLAMMAYAPPAPVDQAQLAKAPGDSVAGTFASSTAPATSATLFAKQNTSIAVNMTAVTASSTSIILENRVGGGTAWSPIKSYSTATAVNDTIVNDYGFDLYLRLRSKSIPSADTVTYALTRVIASRTVQEWFNNNGTSVFRINDVGTVTPKITATSIVGTVTGTADSATGAARAQKLTTARAIGGASFDGTAAITPGTASSTPSTTVARDGSGNFAAGTITATLTGTADSATGATRAAKLTTARTINGTSFDGTGNVTVTAAASTLTGTTLNSGVTASSLTSLGTQGANLLFTDATFDIGATGATRPRDFFLSRNATLGGSLTFGTAATQVIPGATSFSIRNNANSADNLIITDAGVVTTAIQASSTNSLVTGDINLNTSGTSLLKMGNIQVVQRTHATGAVLISTTGAGITLTPATVTTVSTGLIEKHYAPTYSSSITPDASLGNSWTITASNGTAFTINAPTNPATGQRITLTIRNTSGGTQGAVTFNAAFKTAGYTVAANGFSASADFEYDGTNWVQKTLWTSAIPN